MRKRRSIIAVLLVAIMISLLPSSIVFAMGNEETIIKPIEVKKIVQDTKSNNITFKSLGENLNAIGVEKPFVTGISKSSSSIGSYYHAVISLTGLARRGNTVYIKLDDQIASYEIDETNVFGFTIETKSRSLTVQLYSMDKEGNKSDYVTVNLTDSGDTVLNNGTTPTTNFDPGIVASDKRLVKGSSFNPLLGVTAKDKEDGDLTKNITVIENNVDTDTIGEYKVVYQVTDSDKNVVVKEIKISIVESIDVISVSLNKTSVNLIKWGSVTLIPTINPSDAPCKDVTWTSDNIKVAAVDSNGKVTGLAIGEATITVTTKDGNKTATAKVIVDFPTSDWKTHWGASYIRNAMSNGWVSTSETFRPDDDITRAEFVKIVNKAFGYTEKGTLTYTDVKKEAWYYDEVAIAAKAGYISTANSTFRPNDQITREEVAAIVTTIKKNKDNNLDKLSKYQDANLVSLWAKSSVEGAIEAKYMGVNVTKFNPKYNISRAEAVTTLMRVVSK